MIQEVKMKLSILVLYFVLHITAYRISLTSNEANAQSLNTRSLIHALVSFDDGSLLTPSNTTTWFPPNGCIKNANSYDYIKFTCPTNGKYNLGVSVGALPKEDVWIDVILPNCFTWNWVLISPTYKYQQFRQGYVKPGEVNEIRVWPIYYNSSQINEVLNPNSDQIILSNSYYYQGLNLVLKGVFGSNNISFNYDTNGSYWKAFFSINNFTPSIHTLSIYNSGNTIVQSCTMPSLNVRVSTYSSSFNYSSDFISVKPSDGK